ncbi:caffeoyl-CoA O-methyltransferase [Vibrio sp.]|nr:caffeoyl-CoA O-methyltransferase [Vibrio sp.]
MYPSQNINLILNSFTTECYFIFLDAERTEYMNFADQVIQALAVGGTLVCDNAISHEEEMVEFIHFIKQSNQFLTSLVPVGKGEFVACKIA